MVLKLYKYKWEAFQIFGVLDALQASLDFCISESLLKFDRV